MLLNPTPLHPLPSRSHRTPRMASKHNFVTFPNLILFPSSWYQIDTWLLFSLYLRHHFALNKSNQTGLGLIGVVKAVLVKSSPFNNRVKVLITATAVSNTCNLIREVSFCDHVYKLVCSQSYCKIFDFNSFVLNNWQMSTLWVSSLKISTVC